MFILDTDHIGIIHGRVQPEYARLVARMAQHPSGHFFYSIISFHEHVLGWNIYLSRARNTSAVVMAYAMFQGILGDFAEAQVLPFDQRAANLFDSLRARKIRVGTMDLRIATIALAHGYTVLTRNLKDFRKVPGVNAEDWT
jgi:tRNA(fMet)-specific endonuclease VapC